MKLPDHDDRAADRTKGALMRITVMATTALVLVGCGTDFPTETAQPTVVPTAPQATSSSVVAPAASPSTSDPWMGLETALRLPTVPAGQACPRASGRIVSPAFGEALGDGPVYPVGLGADGVLHVVAASAGYLQKVLWVASPAYLGPVLIRGGRIDGPGGVQFSAGQAVPAPEFRLDQATATSEGEEPGWREWPSSTYVPSPGCYAYQIDGAGFTKIVVFEAVSGA